MNPDSGGQQNDTGGAQTPSTGSPHGQGATFDREDSQASSQMVQEMMKNFMESFGEMVRKLPAHEREREPDVEAPDYFRGKKSSCETFIAGCRAVFEAQPRRYRSDKDKIFYMGSRLKDVPRRWYDTYLVKEPEDRPDFFRSHSEFVKELRRIYGEKDPSASARRQLFGMRMTGEDAQAYIQNFQRLVMECGWDIDCEPLASSFYEGLTVRFKNDLDEQRDARNEAQLPNTTELMRRATDLNKRYFSNAEAARAEENRNKGRGKKNNDNPSSGGPSSGTGKAETPRRTDKGPNVTGKPFRSFTLSSEGKLPRDELDLRKKFGECLRCGDPAHKEASCSASGKDRRP